MSDHWEARIDRQIREAQERGDFDDLPGTGKPLPGKGEQLAEDWWLREYVKREKLGSAVLPTTLRLRREIEDLERNLSKKRTETAVRQFVDDLNTQIRAAQIGPVDGPPVSLKTVDAEEAVKAWRDARTA
ncbi:MAG: DUF1992 domain-containing protein [Stackebrandtia sp.]